jgi:hypothetical protein
MVISRSHQARMSLSQRPTRTVPPRAHAEQSSRRTGRQTALTDVRYPRHPGHCLQACSFASFTPPPAGPRCHRNIRDRHQTSVHRVCCPVACSIAQIASPAHPSAIAADHSLRDSCHLRGPGRWEAVLLTLRTRLGYRLARGFKPHSGRLFVVHSHWQAASAAIFLHSFDASSSRHADRLGRLRDPLRLVIRQRAHVGPDAISAGSSGSAEAREPSKPLNAFTPEASRQALSMAGAP